MKATIGYSKNRSLSTPSCSLAFAITVSVILIPVIFYYRDPLLGLDIFYVPSESMKPTLIPGDIVLVDTKHYESTEIMNNDIVVFYHDKYKINLVKRVKNVSEDRFTVSGDNTHRTVSIAQIGVIKHDALIGKVTAVLVNTKHFTTNPRVLREVK